MIEIIGDSIVGDARTGRAAVAAVACGLALALAPTAFAGTTASAAGRVTTAAADPATSVSPSPRAIHRLLAAILMTPEIRGSLYTVLSRDGSTVTFSSLGAGRARIAWYSLPMGVHRTTTSRPRPVLVAFGQVGFARAGPVTLRLRLTRRGQRLLRSAAAIDLQATATYVPSGGCVTALTHRLTLEL